MVVQSEKNSAYSSIHHRSGLESMSRMQQDLLDSRSSMNGMTTLKSKILRRTLPRGRKPHVCVVGAGFAGLRCADVLLQQGAQVTIFEARDRVGGRLYQSKVGDHLVDMGPNWIHGTENNPILDLVRETGTPTHSWGERQVTFDSEGEMIPEIEAAECSQHMWELIGKAMKHSNAHSASISPDQSLLDYIKTHAEGKFREPFPEAYRPENEVHEANKHDLLLKMAESWGAFIGGNVATQSLKFLWLEECLDGENLFCAGTYAKVLEFVAKPALEGANVKFKNQVTKIASGMVEGNVQVMIETASGVTESFDEVVVTAPLGWLKKRKDVFEPALPKRLCEAVDSLGYGNLDKVYITFPKPFWETPAPVQLSGYQQVAANASTPTLPLHTPEVPPIRSNEISNLTIKQSCPPITSTRNHYPGFTNFLSPKYASSNPNAWTQEALNLAALHPASAHPTLLFYTTGSTSTHIANMLKSHPPNSPSLQEALWNFFKHYVSKLPNYSPSDDNCTPSAILATGWQNDEFAGWGSYTNFPVGLVNGDEDVRVLREGCVDRRVWFAGEHCAPFVALGTVTGAYWSGESVGWRIGEVYGIERKEDGNSM